MSVTRRRGKSARPRRPDAHRPAAGAAASIYALAAFFLILGVGSIVVGAHDAALTQPTLGETAASALLIVGGILLVVAAANLDHLVRRTAWRYHRRPPCHPTVLVACLVALLFGVYVLFSGLGSPARQRWVVVAVALVIIGAAAFGLVLFGRDVELTLPRVGAAVALALLGTTVGAYEFWYQNQYIGTRRWCRIAQGQPDAGRAGGAIRRDPGNARLRGNRRQERRSGRLGVFAHGLAGRALPSSRHRATGQGRLPGLPPRPSADSLHGRRPRAAAEPPGRGEGRPRWEATRPQRPAHTAT